MNFIQKEDIIERVEWWHYSHYWNAFSKPEIVCIVLTMKQTKRMNSFGVWGNIGANIYGPHGIEFKKISDIFLGKDGQYKENINKVVNEANIEMVIK